MRASIALVLAAAAVSAVGGANPGPPVDDIGWCVVDGGNVVIPVLANDPDGTLLCALNTTPLPADLLFPAGTLGRVEMRGDQVQYFPPNGYEGLDRFTYETNGGTATVVVNVVNDIQDCGLLGGGGGSNDAFPVTLVNNTNFGVNFFVTSNNRIFFRDCTPLTNPDDETGFITVAGMAMEPGATTELCTEITDSNGPNTLIFQAIQDGAVDPLASGTVTPVVDPSAGDNNVTLTVTFQPPTGNQTQGTLLLGSQVN